MQNPKFKSGDRVEILYGNLTGTTGTVGELWFDGDSTCYTVNSVHHITYKEDELRLVEPEPKFKPGDKVEILFGDFAGKICTINKSWLDKNFNTGRWYKLNEEDIMNYKEEELRLVEPETKPEPKVTHKGDRCRGCTYKDNYLSTEPCLSCSKEHNHFFPIREKPEEPKADTVNHPSHYEGHSSIECIEAMELAYGREAVLTFCQLNAFKYLWRHKFKGGKEDLKKAERYLDMYEDIKARPTGGIRYFIEKYRKI